MSSETCDSLRSMLVEYADGELATHELGRLEGHLAECRVCRQRLTALRWSLSVAHQEWSPTPAQSKIRSRRWPRAISLSLASISVAASLIALLAFWPTRSSHVPGQAEPSDALQVEMAVWQVGAAASLLHAGDELAKMNGGAVAAESTYEFIDAHFSDTEAARESRTRLARLQKEGTS